MSKQERVMWTVKFMDGDNVYYLFDFDSRSGYEVTDDVYTSYLFNEKKQAMEIVERYTGGEIVPVIITFGRQYK